MIRQTIIERNCIALKQHSNIMSPIEFIQTNERLAVVVF